MDNGSESLIINGEPETLGDEFYEKIEAPKFVDLTAPDPFQPGEDRSWFCLRVGCDQNHDEEMDSEAIYKNFVLRVMAARSPNIRLRRALCRKDSGYDAKCPRTVPAKPSKSRVARTVLISSISKRMVDTKVKVKPLSKKNATPRDKAKRVSIIAKAMTTPRSKKQLAKPEAFRSVRNPKAAVNAAASNNRAVAKALVFDSPKKMEKSKILVDLNTPLKNLCEGMKKLEITSSKKQDFGNRTLETDRKKLRGREVKSRVFDGLNCQKDRIRNVESSKCLEKSKKENKLQKTTEIPRPLSNEENVEPLQDASRIDSNTEGRRSGDDKEWSSNFDDSGNDNEEMESDDKENALASDNIRKSDVQKRHTENKIFEECKNLKGNQERTVTAKSKQSKEIGAQCLKLKKPKPTNPKPFRLRTDERGILKEANSEKKLCSTQNKHTRDAKEHSENHDTTNEMSQMEGPENQLQNRTLRMKNVKMSSIPQRHTISSKQKLVSTPKSENSTKHSKSPSVKKLLRLKECREPLSENEMALGKMGKLGTIKENNLTISSIIATSKQRENSASMATKASTRSKTIPKEPNFHSVHIPKSCTKRLVIVDQ